MDQEKDEQAWLTFGDARLRNLAYTNRHRTAYLASLIEHASEKLNENGCSSMLPLKIAPARFDDSRYYHLHITSDFRPRGKNGAFHFREPLINTNLGHSEPAKRRAKKLALAARAYLQSCQEWAKEAEHTFAGLTQKRLPKGFKLAEVAVCVDHDGQHKFSAEFDTLEIDLQTSRARIVLHSMDGPWESFEQEVRLHRYRQKHLNSLTKAGGDIFLDRSAQYVFANSALTPQDVLSAMTGYREIGFGVNTPHAGYEAGTFLVYDGILFADYSPNRYITFEDGKLIVWTALPVLALEGAKGRPLKTIVETGSLFDEAIIETAESWAWDRGTRFTLAPGHQAVRL